MIENLVELTNNMDVDYGEIRIQINNMEGCSFRNRTLENLTTGYELGGIVRIFNNGNWAHVSFNSLKEIKNAIGIAKKFTSFYKKNNNKRFLPVCNVYFEKKPFANEISINEKKNLLSNYYKYIIKHEYIEKCNLIYIKNRSEKILVTTDKTNIYMKNEEDVINIQLSKDSTKNSTSKIIKSCNGFANLPDIGNAIDNTIDELNENIVQDEFVKGRYPVLLDGNIAGVFFHEAIGHLFEADNIINNEFLKNRIYNGKKIADSSLTIVDNPSIIGHSGSYLYDDEGIKSNQTCIIKKGIVKQNLHSRETAILMDEKTTGNARAASFYDLPLVRMSNFCVSNGERKVKELINDIQLGVYACGSEIGKTKLDEFMLIPKKCYLIKNGKIKYRIPNKCFAGNTFRAINDMELSKEVIWNDSGYCKKSNQKSLPIAICSPTVKLNNIIIKGDVT